MALPAPKPPLPATTVWLPSTAPLLLATTPPLPSTTPSLPATVPPLPAFSGLYAPHWRSDARGLIAGLTRFADKGHFARAALEATAYQTREALDAMTDQPAAFLDAPPQAMPLTAPITGFQRSQDFGPRLSPGSCRRWSQPRSAA